MKKIISLILCMVLLFSLAAQVSAEDFSVSEEAVENFITGDVSGDGKINATDARMILRYSAKLQELSREQLKLADIDRNSVVNASDARCAMIASRSTLHPSYACINNVSLSFYIVNSKAYVSYFASSKQSGVDVTIKLYKGKFTIFSFASDKQSTNKKYISGLFTAPVDDFSGYSVEITVESGGEKVSKSASFDYVDKRFAGDVSGDGKINANDARMILRHSAKLQRLSSEQLKKADIDGNSRVNSADARCAMIIASRV